MEIARTSVVDASTARHLLWDFIALLFFSFFFQPRLLHSSGKLRRAFSARVYEDTRLLAHEQLYLALTDGTLIEMHVIKCNYNIKIKLSLY